MPELRKDPTIGRWVMVDTERVRRPRDFMRPRASRRGGPCALCPGHERETPPEVLAYRVYRATLPSPTAQLLQELGATATSYIDTTAQNGQYLGLFQMGSYERELFGHGDTAHAQAIAAHRYFVRSGQDWSPWSCRWAAV